MKRIILCAIVSLMTSALYAQYIDSNKNVIFQLDKPQTSQVKLNGNEVSFEGNYLRFLRFYSNENDETSAVKVDVVGIKIGLVNTGKILDVDEFDLRDYGANIQFSYKWTLKDSIYSSRSVITGLIGLKYQFDKFKLYDPTTQNVSRETPSELSLVGNLTKYLNNYRFAIALTGEYNIVTYNKSGLVNYKNNSGLIQDGDVVAFKNFDGKYGTIANNINGARASISFPVFFKNRIFNWNRMPYLTPVPYFSTRVTKDLKPTHNLGVSLNMLESKPFKDRKFTLPSSVGIGIDWAYLSGTWSKANIFLSGSIAFK